MKFLKYIIPAAFVIAATGCTEGVMNDINFDDHHPQPDVVSPKLQLPEAIMSTGFSTTSGDYSFYLASLTEQMLGSGNNQLMKAELRNPAEWASSTTFNNVWGSTYSNLYNISEIIRKVNAQDNDIKQIDILGMAQVLWVVNFGHLTDAHGDIPYSETCQAMANVTPKIDTQESIYTDLMKVIDEAIENLTKAVNSRINNAGVNDLIYNGESSKWLAAAYAVKARYALHQCHRNSAMFATAKSAAQKALDLGFVDFAIPGDGNIFNGVNCDNPWSAFYWSRYYSASSNTVVDLMTVNNDPRLDPYTYGAGYGFNPGNDEIAKTTNNKLVPMWLDNGAQALTIVGVPEVNFILAECQVRDNEDATAAYQAGVAAAVEAVYEACGAYIDGMDFASTLSTPSLQDVYTQKYLSQIIDQQFEGYNDIRRAEAMGETFVTLTNPKNTQSGINRWPYLLPYGNSDVISNPNVTAAYGDGYYIYTTKAWLYK